MTLSSHQHKNYDHPNATDEKIVTLPVLLVSVIFVPIVRDSWWSGGTVSLQISLSKNLLFQHTLAIFFKKAKSHQKIVKHLVQ